MKILKNKAFLGGVCLLLAAGIAFFVIPGLYANQSATAIVASPAQEITAGTVITAEMVTTTEVGTFGLPAGIVQKPDDVIGKVATEPIHAGEFFWAEELSTEADYKASAQTVSNSLEDGCCLVTIKLSTASAGIAGVLRPGNIVDVFELVENYESGEYSAEKALDNIYVADVLNPSLVSLSELDRMAEAADGSGSNLSFEPAYVVFRCTEAQAQALIRLEKADALHLTLQKQEG